MKQIVYLNDIAYKVLRSVPMHNFGKTEPDPVKVENFKQFLGADTVLNSETHMMFCETIPDVEFEEITPESNAV